MATPTNLPSSFVAGEILTAANMNLLRGGFRVLQVVFGSIATPVSSSTTALADTGLTATITPQFNTSKILVLVAQNGGDKSSGNAANAIKLVLLRGATTIQQITNSAGFTGSAVNIRLATLATAYLDSPATTSATTYKTQFSNGLAAASVSLQVNSETSTIVLLEISA